MKLNNTKPFYFGAATSSFQVEGGANLGGKTDSIWDEFTRRNYYIPQEGSTEREINYIDVSSDFYHNYKQDIARMKEMGLTMFRFSIAWARIFPKNEHDVNLEGVKFYHDVIDELIKNGIEPLVTLFHWDVPVWVQCRNGFLNRETTDLFEKYAQVVFREYGQKVKYFLTFNEMVIFNKNQFIWGSLTPEYKNRSDLMAKSMHYCHVACAKAVNVFKTLRSQGIVSKSSLIGITHTDGPVFHGYEGDLEAQVHENLIGNLAYFKPSFDGEYPNELFKLWNKVGIDVDIRDEDLMLLKNNTHEFIGWNYYQPMFVKKTNKFGVSSDIFGWNETKIPSEYKTTKWNWIISPELMVESLRDFSKNYPHLPIIITENGYGDFDDEIDGKIYDVDRINYIKDHLDGCYTAINDYDINLIGYNYWSFQDIFSPSAGYRKRYGFVKVDFDSLVRTNKLSYYYYQSVINDPSHDSDYDIETIKKNFEQSFKDGK